MKYVIRDWAGNYPLEPNKFQSAVQLGNGPIHTFPSFDDAWDYILEHLAPNEEDIEKFYVDEVNQ